ncbi:MAG: hypothetical protein E7457_04210 [Ruminococcaceae bacterium]|nr:hypothetical protein [Oscillospiraceae bacterium]
MEFSVPMALVDFIPVALFLAGAILLQQDLYPHMSKGAFSLFSAGTINIFCAGALKATYKLLYALQICNFEKLNAMFFPVQSIGFLLAGLGMVLYLRKPRKRIRAVAAAPAVFSGTFLFVGLMVAGLAMIDAVLIVLAKRQRQWGAIVCLAVSFLCCLCMGYLSSQNFAQASMNWLAEGINIIGQGAFLTAAVSLHRSGLGNHGATN